MSLGLAEECIPANRFCKTEIFDLVVLRKKYLVLRRLSDFELKKGRDILTKSVFQSNLGLIIMSLGLAEECIPANRFCKTKIFDLIVLRKKYFGGC